MAKHSPLSLFPNDKTIAIFQEIMSHHGIDQNAGMLRKLIHDEHLRISKAEGEARDLKTIIEKLDNLIEMAKTWQVDNSIINLPED